jgi:transcriptional activator SPT8
MQGDAEPGAPGESTVDPDAMEIGGPVQPPETKLAETAEDTKSPSKDEAAPAATNVTAAADPQDPVPNADPEPTKPPPDETAPPALTNGLPHSDEPLTAPPTDTSTAPNPDNTADTSTTTTSDLPPQSESTFLDAAQDGTLRIWDRRAPTPVATIAPYAGTPPWCTGACWSPDGNFFYAGRRNGTVEEYSIHHLGTKRSEPNRIFKFPQGSGPVYAVRAMPNGKHLIW